MLECKADISQDTTPEEWGHVALHIDQVEYLARALQTLLDVEKTEPLEGDQIGALAGAIVRAAEDTASLFEAYYHPRPISGPLGQPRGPKGDARG